MTPDGQQIVIRYVLPGDLFGIAVAIGRTDYPGTAAAVIDSAALGWEMSAWPEMMERCPAMVRNVVRTLGGRAQEFQARIGEISTGRVERRVAQAVLRLVAQAGEPTEDGRRIAFPVSRQDLAQLTGTTLHNVSRIVSGWEREGIVAGGRERIVFRDGEALRRIAENSAE